MGKEQVSLGAATQFPDGESEADTAFRKLRSDVRVLLGMTSAGLIMSIIILFGVLFMHAQI